MTDWLTDCQHELECPRACRKIELTNKSDSCAFYLQLPLDHLQQNLSKEMAKLKEMAPHLSDDQDGQGTLQTCNDAQMDSS